MKLQLTEHQSSAEELQEGPGELAGTHGRTWKRRSTRPLESSPGQGPAEELQEGPGGPSRHMEDTPLTKGQTNRRKDP